MIIAIQNIHESCQILGAKMPIYLHYT